MGGGCSRRIVYRIAGRVIAARSEVTMFVNRALQLIASAGC